MQPPPASDQMVQYRVAADHRLHFGRLFFQVTAFNLAFALALYVVVADRLGPPTATALSGCVLIGTAVVASRLLRQERGYATAIAAIEAAHEELLAVEPTPGRGARVATVFGLAAAGALLLIASWLEA
ncbi:hypothetical protein [Sphingomonas sp. BK580]|uniref:hypothetical protein n=1 Tax=Sphingomonas sp. BK580 TaxID=2586972 RepID=UPI0016217F9C|nr:hypothetical protein [Sphingomonas sp. BK580]MBB3695851.1 hypothetical protein [Sphingomonas sp. BK580]